MRSPAMLPPREDKIQNQDSKSPAISPTRKDPIPNQDSNRIGKKKSNYSTTFS